jgi:hypothetical protein
MPRWVYERVMKFPMHILKPNGLWDKDTDVEYMSFADAHILPFTIMDKLSLVVPSLLCATPKQKKTVTKLQLYASSK